MTVSRSAEQAATAVENSYLMSAVHRSIQDMCIRTAEGKGELALIGMEQSKDHVEEMLRKVTV